MRQILFIIFYVLTHTINGQSIIEGIVVDETLRPISYVNIGILTRGVGTVSNLVGKFQLEVPQNMMSDSLLFSHVGYLSETVPINIIRAEKNQIILKDAAITLDGVSIQTSRLQAARLGNHSKSGLLISGFSKGDLGGEIGSKFNVKHTPSFIEGFGFYVNHNSFDSVIMRLKVYTTKKNRIDKKIGVSKPFTVVGAGARDFKLDWPIALEEDIIVTIEMLDHFPKNKGSIYFSQSAPFLGKMYFRPTSQDQVKKYIGGPMSLHLNIKY